MKKVVIIGGGFAGARCARLLEKDFDVTLIDTKNYYEFTPGILRTLVSPSHVKEVQVLHTHYLKRARFIMDKVIEVNENYVKTKKRKISFNYLVIASGSSYNTPIKESNIIKATRASRLRDYSSKIWKANKILVIGGGLVGVELAAELATFCKDKEITIVHSKDRLMERNNPKSSKYAEKFLKSHGVKILFNEKVTDGKGKFFITDKGTKIHADLAFLCTGITPNYEFMLQNFKKSLNERNQIEVNEFLQLKNHKNIFVAGDVTDRQEEKTAQTAEKQAGVVISNIRSLESSQPLKEYSSKKRPLAISLGRYNGIFEDKSIVITGLIPALIKYLVEKKAMWRYKH